MQPYLSLKTFVYGRLAAAKHRAAYRRLAERGYAQPILEKRPKEALAPEWTDLWFLYQNVRASNPRTILEFGSGCSTTILAQALADNGRTDSSLISIDAEAHWAEVTRKSIPPHLQRLVQVHHCAAVPVNYEGTLAWEHAGLPAVEPDFIYLDGPALTAERQVAIDVVKLEAGMPAGSVIIIDGRDVQVEFLRRTFKRRHEFSRHSFPRHRVLKFVA